MEVDDQNTSAKDTARVNLTLIGLRQVRRRGATTGRSGSGSGVATRPPSLFPVDLRGSGHRPASQKSVGPNRVAAAFPACLVTSAWRRAAAAMHRFPATHRSAISSLGRIGTFVRSPTRCDRCWSAQRRSRRSREGRLWFLFDRLPCGEVQRSQTFPVSRVNLRTGCDQGLHRVRHVRGRH